MLRAIVSVIVGYVALSLWVFVTLGVAWFALGSEFALSEGTHEATTGWTVLMIGMGAIGAVIGGLITASSGRAVAPVKVLAGLVLVVGLALAVYAASRPSLSRLRPHAVGAVRQRPPGQAAAVRVPRAADRNSPDAHGRGRAGLTTTRPQRARRRPSASTPPPRTAATGRRRADGAC